MIKQEKLKNFITELKDKVQALDYEERVIEKKIKSGAYAGQEKRKRQKMCIRCFYLHKIYSYLFVLGQLEAEKKFVEEVWGRRKRQYTDSYEDKYRQSKLSDYPKVGEIKKVNNLK